MKKIPVRHINIPPQEVVSAHGFTIRTLHELMGGKEMVQELHRHEYYYLLVLEKGKGAHEIDFVKYPIRNHSLFFMRPGQVHELTLKAGSTGYMMQFNADFYYPADKSLIVALREASNTNQYLPDARSFPKINLVLAAMQEEITRKRDRYQDVIKANLGILFIELNRQTKSRVQNTSRYATERFHDFTELLSTHAAVHKQVSEYADMMNLSVYQLNSITKETVGRTCSELINDHMLLEAKRYLLATSNQVNQIAYHLGFEDASYFIRFFKKHTGQSPESFRQNSR